MICVLCDTALVAGTHGGVTLFGLLAAAVGGALVGVGFYLPLLFLFSGDALATAPAQWPIIIVGALCGVLGSLVDSVLGATLQFSGEDEDTGAIVQVPEASKQVREISGTPLLDNHCVNLVTSILMALLSPSVGVSVWRYFV